jgi:hypothetical protein
MMPLTEHIEQYMKLVGSIELDKAFARIVAEYDAIADVFCGQYQNSLDEIDRILGRKQGEQGVQWYKFQANDAESTYVVVYRRKGRLVIPVSQQRDWPRAAALCIAAILICERSKT